MNFDCLIVDVEVELAETTCEYFKLFDVRTAYATSAQALLALRADTPRALSPFRLLEELPSRQRQM